MTLGSKFSSVCAGVFLALIAVGPASAQTVENLWQEVQAAGVLRCGAAVAPPHVIRDAGTGEFSGLFVDVCREFAEQALGVKAEIVDTTWDNIVAGLQAKRWDLSMALNRTPKRALAIAFSQSVWDYQISFVYNAGNTKIDAAGRSLADFDKPGVSIAVMSGTAQEAALTPQLKNATLMSLPDNDASRLAVMSKRADILADDADANMLFSTANGADWKTVLPEPALAKQGIAFGIRREVNAADIEAFNIFIQEKIAKGEVDAIVKDYVSKILAQ